MKKILNTDFLICPESGRKLIVDFKNNVAASDSGHNRYPVFNGIIDLCTEKKDSISNSYDRISPGYDKLLTGEPFFARLYNKIVWGLKDSDYVERLLKLFPVSVNKTILDIPAGTGVFTRDLYKQIHKKNRISVIDYSNGMLKRAKERYSSSGLNNIVYIRGDVNKIPVRDNTVDILLTMNGYHAFPDKVRALNEIARVIKPGGKLLGCFYIKGQRAFTDFFINRIYKNTGTFIPPFNTFGEVKIEWGKHFSFEVIENYKSIIYFSAIKNRDS